MDLENRNIMSYLLFLCRAEALVFLLNSDSVKDF